MTARLTRVGTTVTVAAVALVASATLAGCSGADPRAAAVVNGEAISEADLDTFVSDIVRSSDPATAAQVSPGAVLTNMIFGRIVRQHTNELAAPVVTTEQARAMVESPSSGLFAKPITNPAPATVEAVREFLVLQGLSGNAAAKSKAMALIQSARVEVNPKYGTFDSNQGMVPRTPNWMVPGATPAAPASAQETPSESAQPSQPTPATTIPAPTGSTTPPATGTATTPAPTTPKVPTTPATPPTS